MNRIIDDGKNYVPYKNLPPLAGLVGHISEAITNVGLSVDEVVTRLKRFHFLFRRLHEVFIHALPSEPIYELKMAYSLHAYYCAEHVAALRKRISEMREPPLGLDKIPHPALQTLLDEILKTPHTIERLVGVYHVILPALKQCLSQLYTDTHPLADHPTRRVLRFALLEVEDMVAYGEKAVPALTEPTQTEALSRWSAHLHHLIAQAGDLDGTVPPIVDHMAPAEASFYAHQPYQMNVVVQRDERFSDPWNMGVNAEVYLHEPAYDNASKVIMMFYKRLREIDVPEMMASIIAQTPDKPWGYYQDMTRQLWDEARHAMMGELGFISLGIDWKDVPINHTWSMGLNTQLQPLERHAVLYFIEQGLMPKTGKRLEWEVGVASQHPLAGLFQDYDWADEVLHSQIGRTWYVSQMNSTAEAIRYGDECWSKVLMDWATWKKEGKTEHRNWWPEIYTRACAAAGLPVRPDQLAYDVSYASTRADLKNYAE